MEPHRSRRRRAGRRRRHHRHLPAVPRREAGFSVQLLEAGGGVGGTWFWNRYPGARFDSESYTYGYLFSKELFDEWEWQEHFAGQPETERYLNHVVDRFDLRRHIRFDAPVTSAVWDETSATWVVTAGDGSEHPRPVPRRRDRRALGAVPPRRAGARGLPRRAAPHRPLAGGARRLRRQARRGHRHVVERRAGRPDDPRRRRALTVYQRTANWCTPLNNRPITPEEQAELRADFEALRETLNTSLSGFAHPVNERAAFDDSDGRAAGVLREDVEQPGLHEAHEQLLRPAVQRGGERRVVRVHRREDPRHRATTPRRPSG